MPSSVTTNVLDFTSDVNNEELARLVRVYDFPGFVKSANMEDLKRPPAGAVSQFGDPRHRLYSCHSAPATWIEALYFLEKKAEFHPKDQARIQQRIEGFVNYFKIKPHYDRLVKQAFDLHREVELPDSSYAYVWVADDGRKERHLPLRSGMEVKAAAEWLHDYRDRLPYHDRNTVAIKIMEKAAHFGALIGEELNDFIEKQAGCGVCDPEEVFEQLMHRARLTKVAAHKQGIIKLAQIVRDKPRIALQPEGLVKLAVTMDTIDRALNVHEYGDILQRPEDVIFKVTFSKAASDRAELCALTTGNVYSKDQFEKLSRDDVEALMGEDFAREVSSGLSVSGEKMAEIAHTLPRPDAELLDKLMAEVGAPPQMTKAASCGHGLTNEQLEALAAAYEIPA
jgi:hypothetical protein